LLNLVHMLGFTTLGGITSGSIKRLIRGLASESWSNDLRRSVGAHMRTVDICSWLFIPVA
jgi:hypothetical protein